MPMWRRNMPDHVYRRWYEADLRGDKAVARAIREEWSE